MSRHHGYVNVFLCRVILYVRVWSHFQTAAEVCVSLGLIKNVSALVVWNQIRIEPRSSSNKLSSHLKTVLMMIFFF